MDAWHEFMALMRRKRRNNHKLEQVLIRKNRQTTKTVIRGIKHVNKCERKWLAEVRYALGIYLRENCFRAWKTYLKYNRVRKMVVQNRKLHFVAQLQSQVDSLKVRYANMLAWHERKRRVQTMIALTENIIHMKEKRARYQKAQKFYERRKRRQAFEVI